MPWGSGLEERLGCPTIQAKLTSLRLYVTQKHILPDTDLVAVVISEHSVPFPGAVQLEFTNFCGNYNFCGFTLELAQFVRDA